MKLPAESVSEQSLFKQKYYFLSVLQDAHCAKQKKHSSQPHYLYTSTSVSNGTNSAHLWSGESWFSCHLP